MAGGRTGVTGVLAHLRPGLVVTLMGTMAAATFGVTVFGVLAADLVSEFQISRATLGLLVTTAAVVSAAMAPLTGVVFDNLGARRSVLATIFISAISLFGVGAAPNLVILLAAAALVGAAQGAGNPGTNKVIALHVPAGMRGVATGLKQSGVQVGTLIAGLLLPFGAVRMGWRSTVLIAGLVALLILVLAWYTIPHGMGARHPVQSSSGEVPGLAIRLAIYGLLLGAGGSAVLTFVPLFAQESLGLSPVLGGLALALLGAVAAVSRVGLGLLAERSLGPIPTLRLITVIAAGAATAFALAAWIHPGFLWVGAALAGASVSSWNAVAMLAVITWSPQESLGRASGTVLIGFYLGLALGAPVFGLAVDRTDFYPVAWLATGAFMALGLLILRLGKDH